MTQHVAFYEALQDEITTLPDAGDTDKDIYFRPPLNTATDNRSILSFMASVQNAVNLQFRITLNDVDIVTRNENGNSRLFVQEVINSNLIKPDQQNKLTCKISSGSGKFSYSDMVIWYQRNI